MNLKEFKNIFFDRDGVINEVIMRGNEVSSPRILDEFKIRDDFLELIKYLDDSINCFVVTNQPDISRGFLQKNDMLKMHKIINDEHKFIEINYCPHDNYHKCQCRKPKPGMINDLIKKYDLKKPESIMIGDSFKDVKAAINANIKCIYLKTAYNDHISDVFTIKSLKELV